MRNHLVTCHAPVAIGLCLGGENRRHKLGTGLFLALQQADAGCDHFRDVTIAAGGDSFGGEARQFGGKAHIIPDETLSNVRGRERITRTGNRPEARDVVQHRGHPPMHVFGAHKTVPITLDLRVLERGRERGEFRLGVAQQGQPCLHDLADIAISTGGDRLSGEVLEFCAERHGVLRDYDIPQKRVGKEQRAFVPRRRPA